MNCCIWGSIGTPSSIREPIKPQLISGSQRGDSSPTSAGSREGQGQLPEKSVAWYGCLGDNWYEIMEILDANLYNRERERDYNCKIVREHHFGYSTM